MNFRKRKTVALRPLDITPLIDIIFILNVFFMLNMQQQAPHQLRLTLPRVSQAEDPVPSTHDILVDAENQISFQDRRLEMDELPALLSNLPSDSKFTLGADEKADYGRVLRIFDLLRSRGFSSVRLSVTRTTAP